MRVLAALDDSARAPRVLDAAARTAERLSATLVPFRAVQVPPDLPPAAATTGRDGLPDFLVDEAEHSLVMLTTRVAFAHMEAPVVRIGEAWRAILEGADALHADLVVVGSHGYHGVDRVLGTTSHHVADGAHQDVLVVHDRPPTAEVRSVLIALSGSAHDRRVFSAGLAFAHAWGSSVEVLRVVQVANELPPPHRPIVGFLDVSELETTRDLIRLGADDPAITARRVALSVARPWRAIVQAAEDEHVDLIVVGSQAHRTADGLPRSTPSHIADQANENLLIVHEPVVA